LCPLGILKGFSNEIDRSKNPVDHENNNFNGGLPADCYEFF
jgi:hypothetical protein